MKILGKDSCGRCCSQCCNEYECGAFQALHCWSSANTFTGPNDVQKRQPCRAKHLFLPECASFGIRARKPRIHGATWLFFSSGTGPAKVAGSEEQSWGHGFVAFPRPLRGLEFPKRHKLSLVSSEFLAVVEFFHSTHLTLSPAPTAVSCSGTLRPDTRGHHKACR